MTGKPFDPSKLTRTQADFWWLVQELLDDYQRTKSFALIHEYLAGFEGYDRYRLLLSILAHAWETADWALAAGCVDEGYPLMPTEDEPDADPLGGVMTNLGDRPEVVEWLIARGVDIHRRPDFNSTYLIHAAGDGFLGTVRVVLAHDAEVNGRRMIDDRATPLMMAAAYGHADVVELLLAHGADPKLTDSEGNDATELADRRSHWHIVQMLKDAVRGRK